VAGFHQPDINGKETGKRGKGGVQGATRIYTLEKREERERRKGNERSRRVKFWMLPTLRQAHRESGEEEKRGKNEGEGVRLRSINLSILTRGGGKKRDVLATFFPASPGAAGARSCSIQRKKRGGEKKGQPR